MRRLEDRSLCQCGCARRDKRDPRPIPGGTRGTLRYWTTCATPRHYPCRMPPDPAATSAPLAASSYWDLTPGQVLARAGIRLVLPAGDGFAVAGRG